MKCTNTGAPHAHLSSYLQNILLLHVHPMWMGEHLQGQNTTSGNFATHPITCEPAAEIGGHQGAPHIDRQMLAQRIKRRKVKKKLAALVFLLPLAGFARPDFVC